MSTSQVSIKAGLGDSHAAHAMCTRVREFLQVCACVHPCVCVDFCVCTLVCKLCVTCLCVRTVELHASLTAALPSRGSLKLVSSEVFSLVAVV